MAMFSKRHYEVIAGVIRVERDYRRERDILKGGAVLAVQKELARIFTADNPRFDADRFNKACEPGEGGK